MPQCRLLIVDDMKDSAESLATLLRLRGYEAHTAYDGEQAILLAESLRPDIILLDLGMPRLNGYDTCGRIRAQPWGSEIQLVALTGFGQDDVRQRLGTSGFDHHLIKPVELQTLIALIEMLIDPKKSS